MDESIVLNDGIALNDSVVVNDHIVVNGHIASSLDVRDRSVAYGHGVFETMRLHDGQFPLWQFHRQRLAKGLAVLGIPFDESLVDGCLQKLLTHCPPMGVVKLTVTAGITGRGYAIQQTLEPTVVAMWLPIPAYPDLSVCLHICRYQLPENPVLAGIKHLNRLDQILAAREISEGFDLAEGSENGMSGTVPLLLDTSSRVVEALSHNIFVLSDGKWLTPALDRCGVEGVMRALLLEEVIGEAGQTATISNFGVDLLLSAREVFICNSVMGILPVSRLTGRESNYNSHYCHNQTDMINKSLREMYPCYAV